jgi:glucosamine kinase
MILVADSGSSKTDWMGYIDGEIVSFNTKGINPYFLNEQEIYKLLSKNEDLTKFADKVSEIYFFGAGSSSPDKHEVVSNGLSLFFKRAFISVDNDLVGSVYATCGNEKGLSCILGTGSNISYFDGNQVQDSTHGLGYVLGDEGSGTYFGRKLVTSYLYGTMPAALGKVFAKTYDVSKENVITNVYQRPFPNIYLASLSRFMGDHLNEPYIQEILRTGFQEFVDTNIKDFAEYKTLTCHFIGSIAYFYQDILRAVCAQNEIKVGKIYQKPITGIFNYVLHKEGIQLTAD